jgi:hypothetical protein
MKRYPVPVMDYLCLEIFSMAASTEKITDFPDTDLIRTAARFINTTSSHIFLTGKAGTGKTTFLKSLAERTHKSFVVVAPTGIAALNAGGVTIHSQFLLPPGTFLPERTVPPDFSHSGNYFAHDSLARKNPLNSDRKQVLRSIDLLVIDEVSMLRADVLDAIDYRLKAARGNFYKSFGGVQLLLIGDLYQLPPVVKREEESVLRRYYASSWFYEAIALRHDSFVYVELDKIFRQQDNAFIHILNNLRHNVTTTDDIEALNAHYQSPEAIKELNEVITLTTHNYKADELNNRALQELKTPSWYFEAHISGDFPQNMFPVLPKLELKVGAQIMFIKNDSEGKAYFNGKLATVKELSNDQVTVTMGNERSTYVLKKETWENKKYTVNPDTRELDEEVLGTFQQYPIKLAWAITVHKSQGLTFDKAIIDVGQAFADGQVYVALSRLRSLDGLVLRTKINPGVIGTDKNIVAFTEQYNRPDTLTDALKDRQKFFVRDILEHTFNFERIVKEIGYMQQGKLPAFKELSMKPVLTQLEEALNGEKENTQKFNRQLDTMLQNRSYDQLLERIHKGTAYYKNFLVHQLEIVLRHTAEMRHHKRVKTYLNHLNDLDQLLTKKLEQIDKVATLTEAILSGNELPDFSPLTKTRAEGRIKMLEEIHKEIKPVSTIEKNQARKKRGIKNNEGKSTSDITLDLLNAGMSIAGIANERSLTTGTIETHLAKAVAAGRISIFKFMSEDAVNQVAAALADMPEEFSSTQLFTKLNGAYSYGELRAVMAHVGRKPTRLKE